MTGLWIVIISIIVLSIIITNIVALIQTLLHKKNEKYYFDKSFGAYGDKNNPKYLFNNVEHHDFFHVFYLLIYSIYRCHFLVLRFNLVIIKKGRNFILVRSFDLFLFQIIFIASTLHQILLYLL